MLERGDRIGVWVPATCDGDLGAGGDAVRLGAADPQDDAVRTRFEVIQGECGECADAQRLGRIKHRSFVVQHQMHPDELELFDTTGRMTGGPAS